MAHCRSLRSQSSLNSFLFILTASNKTRPISNLCCIDMRLHPSLDGKLPYGRRFVHVPRKNRLHLCGDDANWAATWNRYKTHADFQLDLSFFFCEKEYSASNLRIVFVLTCESKTAYGPRKVPSCDFSIWILFIYFYFLKRTPFLDFYGSKGG